MKGKYLVFASSLDFCGKIYFTEDETSYYNLKGNYIVIGRKNYEHDSQIKALIAHEVGHYHFTSDETKKIEELGVPFALVNILEDARIEKKMVEKYEVKDFFTALHKRSYELYYENNPEAFKNPYNLGVLLRWETYLHIPEERIKNFWEEEFVNDWRKALEKAENSENTSEVVDIAYELFKKWEEKFSSTSPAVCISPEFGENGENLKETFSGKAEIEKKFGNGKFSAEKDGEFPKDIPVFKGEGFELYPLDYPLIFSEGEKLKRYLRKPKKELTVYSCFGKKVNPRRLVFSSVNIFKKSVKIPERKLKTLLILDRSGSMSGVPAKNSDTIASILEHAGLNVDIVVCSTEFAYKVLNVKDLPKIECFGSEGFSRLENFLRNARYDLVVVMSDLFISRSSEKFLKKLKKIYGRRLIGIYTADETPDLERAKGIFGRNFIFRKSVEGVARILGLLILRSL